MQMTPDLWHALVGGLLIGAGAATLLLFNGKIAGISGILDNVVHALIGPQAWRLAFLLGLVAPAAILGLGQITIGASLPVLGLAGILVGWGTRTGSGCTSGHGVCGIANFSPRSGLATATFMITAILVVFLVRHVLSAWHS
jgi:uncharacterized membrane protein YedE/YeeE